MKRETIFTTTGNAYWHYHPIGVGVVFTYCVNSKQIVMTCEHTGKLIEVEDYYQLGGLTQEEFRDISMNFYKRAVDGMQTINLEYMENPTIVGCVGIDFDLLKN